MISGEPCVPASDDMRQRAPDAVDVARERVAVADQGRDVEQRTLDVGHRDGDDINVDGGHMQLVLVIDTLLS